MGFFELRRALTENYQLKIACQQCDSNPGPSAYDAKSQSVALLDQIYIGHLNVDRV